MLLACRVVYQTLSGFLWFWLKVEADSGPTRTDNHVAGIILDSIQTILLLSAASGFVLRLCCVHSTTHCPGYS